MSMNPDGINEAEVKETPSPELATNESDFYKSIDNEQGKISESVRGDEHFQERASEMGTELSPDQIKEKYDELGDPNEKVEAYKDAVLGDHPDWTPEQRAEAIQEAKENWEGDVASREVYQMALDGNDDRVEDDPGDGVTADVPPPDDPGGGAGLDVADTDVESDPTTDSPEANTEQPEEHVDDASDTDSDVEPPIIPDWSKIDEDSDGNVEHETNEPQLEQNDDSGDDDSNVEPPIIPDWSKMDGDSDGNVEHETNEQQLEQGNDSNVDEPLVENKPDGTDADDERMKETEESKKAEGENVIEEVKDAADQESEETNEKKSEGFLNILGRSANGEVVHRIDGGDKEEPGEDDKPNEIRPPTAPDDEGREERTWYAEWLARRAASQGR